jgi:hypothetical protein
MFNFLRLLFTKVAVTTAVVVATATPTPSSLLCHSLNGLPDLNCTPGAVNQNVTQANISSTICVSGYTSKVRPSTGYTNKLKVEQIKEYGYSDTNIKDYEEDHLIPLEIGGSPTDPRNLWPELGDSPNPKDKVENLCHKLVCSGKVSLSEAQKEIASNWQTACQSSTSTAKPTQTMVIPVVATPKNGSIPTNIPVSQPNNGATARCNDGTYSYASSHRGACSRHGGVAQFYK